MRTLALFLLLFVTAPAIAQPPTEQSATGTGAASGDVETLIRILENDEARGRLIDKLRTATAEPQTNGSPAPDASEQTIVDAIAEYARSTVEDTAGLVGATIGLGDQVLAVLSGATAVDMQAVWNAVRNVLLVVTVTFAAYFALRFVFRRFQRELADAAARSSIIRRIGIIVLSAVADVVTVAAAWAVGYLLTLYIGQDGPSGTSRTLFLNAFLSIELIKVAARVLLAPRWPALRFGPIDDTTAAYWYFWMSRLVSVVGYTFLFIAPILATSVSNDAAEALRIVVLFCALTMASIIILQNRDAVRAWLIRHGERGQSEPLVRSLTGLARFWHVVAIGYLILIFILWLADPGTALPFVLAATIQSLLAIAIGVVLTIAVVRLAAGGMHLPADIRARLPLLEQRLNAFVPNVLRVVRTIVMVGVVLAVAQIWRVADFIGWLSSEFGQRVVTSVISAMLILLVGGLVYLAVQSWVEYRLNPEYGRVPTPRERTLLALFRNAFTIALGILVILLVLAELGVNIAPLLAGAGIVGLAVGFGAQKLVQDVINGAFIQFENAMNEGDVVAVGGVTGTVERLTIRSVSLRTLDGAYHLIPFSSVDSVTNFMKNFSYHVAAIGVDYSQDIPEVKKAMQDAFDKLKQTEYGQHVIGDLEMHGVTEFGDSAIMVRARIKTLPGQQFALGRAYNEVIKEVFDQRGIEIPFPHVTMYLGEDKQGNAAPLRIESPLAEAEPKPKPATKSIKQGVAKRDIPAKTPKRQRKTKITQDGPPGEGHEALDEITEA
jgi:moderate conductance mechanosensitive channel